jgi:hypothetical protein
MTDLPQPEWTSAEALDTARRQTKALLTAIPSFTGLTKAERDAMAANTAKVISYMTDPGGVVESLSQAAPDANAPLAGKVPPPPAEALAESAVEATRRSLSQSPGQVGQDFVAGGVREGVEQFGALVQKVDFPKFVGGLIKNVFQAIVESSIQQMRAYGELIANVAKTVDQFMVDNINEGAGRDYLSDKYPDALGVGITSGADLRGARTRRCVWPRSAAK